MKKRWQQKAPAYAAHADDWLVTYADMITLLLCFFALFVALTFSSAKDHPAPPDIIVSPLVEEQQDEPHLFIVPPEEEVRQTEIILDDPTFDPALVKPREPSAIPPYEKEETPAAQAMETPPAPSAATPAAFEQKGDRLTTIEMDSAAFFASGAATLSVPGQLVLKEIAARIQSDAYQGYQVTVEGHTDDTPIHTPTFPSNWELSTARAAAVVHFFLAEGIDPKRLRAAGYADSFPKAPNHDAEGLPLPANQALNRRVVIKLEKVE